MSDAPGMRALRLTLPLALLCACPPGQATDTGTETAGSTAGSSTAGSTASPTTGDPCTPLPDASDDCCCFSLDVPMAHVANICPAPSELCDPVTISCSLEDPDCKIPSGGMGTAGAVTVSDAAALDCILTALRDGTPGSVSWTFADMENAGKFRRQATQIVRADRSVFAITDDWVDLDATLGDLVLAPLRPAADFDACLAQVDIKAKALCLVDTTTGMVTETCAMGGMHTMNL